MAGSDVPLLIVPHLRRYAWAEPTFLRDLLGLEASDVAEAWYGTHPQGTSEIGGGGSLREAIGDSLPYLFKILAAARPLSVQVHPSPAQARAGFQREQAAGVPPSERRYVDPYAKPELFVALTDFEGLCGFREPDEIVRSITERPELSALVGELTPSTSGIRSLLQTYFGRARAEVEAGWSAFLDRLEQLPPDALEPEDLWVLRTRALDEGLDPGLIFFYLLARVRLQPGQAIFLPSGVPHAYLRGAGLELMAPSDNVVRAGLTSKIVDPDEVLRIVRFDARRPQPMEPVVMSDSDEGVYAVPSDLDLRCCRVGEDIFAFESTGPELLLALPDDPAQVATVQTDGGTLELSRGQVCLVPAGALCRVRASSSVPIFRVRRGARAPLTETERAGALRFGTSGLRGLVSDMTDREVYVNARGYLDYLVERGDAVPGTPVCLGGDLRPSTPRMMQAVARAVFDSGLRLVPCGHLPTPALLAFAVERGWPSIMVTGSHIPFDRNGIKFGKPSGEVLKSDEAGIVAAVERVRGLELRRRGSLFDDRGGFLPDARVELGAPTRAAVDAYCARYTAPWGPSPLAGVRVGFYAHSAVGRDLIPKLLTDLGATVIRFGASEQFVPIDTEAVDAEMIADITLRLRAAGASPAALDAVVSTDGDSDRPLVLAPDGDALRFVPGDVLGTLVAQRLGVAAAAVPVSCTDLVERCLDAQVVRTRIGSPWVITAMAELPGSPVAGWEANGGFLLGSTATLPEGDLSPLPTRDAALPIVVALMAARERPLSELLDALPSRFGASGLIDAVPPSDARALARAFGLGPDFRGRLRFQGSTPHPDVDPELADQLHGRLSEVFSDDPELGAVREVDLLDGVRVGFDSGEVIHIRPSGNAPQMRVYVLANARGRAHALVRYGADVVVPKMIARAKEHGFVEDVRANLDEAERLLSAGEGPGLIGTVCGTAAAQAFWSRELEQMKPRFGADDAVSLLEDLPTGQAFGLLLAWKRVRARFDARRGALLAFVFGEGSRATPFTEAEGGQKPALRGIVGGARPPSTVELALRCFAPVEAYLRRSGFEGLVVKWGDEIQVPCIDLRGADPRLAGADVVRFVSMQRMTEDGAASKDWVGVDAKGNVTAFIPRRPLSEMCALAERGLLSRRGNDLFGGVNLGSIAVSSRFLDALLEEFEADVLDPRADRKLRPDLDPQLFTALTVAARPAGEREAAWRAVCAESTAMAELDARMPDLMQRLQRVFSRHGSPKMVALDFRDQYWGDVGQHRQMREMFEALRRADAHAEVSRRIAGLPERPDASGNRFAGDVRLGPHVRVSGSVLIDAHVETGTIRDSVLIGTRAHEVHAEAAFDVGSVTQRLELAPESGAYRWIDAEGLRLSRGERATTVFLPEGPVPLRAHEDTDLRDRARNYDARILGNAISFAEAHRRALGSDPAQMEATRAARSAEVERAWAPADEGD